MDTLSRMELKSLEDKEEIMKEKVQLKELNLSETEHAILSQSKKIWYNFRGLLDKTMLDISGDSEETIGIERFYKEFHKRVGIKYTDVELNRTLNTVVKGEHSRFYALLISGYKNWKEEVEYMVHLSDGYKAYIQSPRMSSKIRIQIGKGTDVISFVTYSSLVRVNVVITDRFIFVAHALKTFPWIFISEFGKLHSDELVFARHGAFMTRKSLQSNVFLSSTPINDTFRLSDQVMYYESVSKEFSWISSKGHFPYPKGSEYRGNSVEDVSRIFYYEKPKVFFNEFLFTPVGG